MERLHPGGHHSFAGVQPVRHDDRVRRVARDGDLAAVNALILGSTTQTAGLFSVIVSDEEGTSISDSAFNFS